ncbi:MAG: outer membrane protein transport protein [Gallionella sp.]
MFFNHKMTGWIVVGALMVMSGGAVASGFALIEQSASGMGNAFAGGAAVAEDASTIFFNPAGMSKLDGKQAVVVLHAISPSAKFSGTGHTGTNMGGDAGGLAFVPNAYFVMDVQPEVKLGLGLNAPFGLQTKYDENWVGRHHAIKSKIQTVNVNPSVSYQVNDILSLGMGLNYQHISGELTEDKGAILGTAIVEGKDSTWGYNLGLLYDMDDKTRLGIAYRSTMSYTLDGTVTTDLPFTNGPVTLDIELPDSLSFSAFHQLSDSYDVMADLTWTGWSTFKEVRVIDANGAAIINIPENWKDTYRFSVGATHHYNEKWTVRTGVAYDQSPIKNKFRTARIPGNHRTWVSLGGQYKYSKMDVIDFGYSHLFVKEATINQSNPGPALVGKYTSQVDIFSVQLTHNF